MHNLQDGSTWESSFETQCCEDEFPSRLNLGKHKYGGPFTTKQVEDVKVFRGILKVVSVIGPVFMLQIAAQSILPLFAMHNVYIVSHDNASVMQEIHHEGMTRHIFISNGFLSPLLVVVCIPLYLCLIRPRIFYYVPGILKRIGVGIILITLSLVIALAMDVVVHALNLTQNACLVEYRSLD